MSEFSHVLGSNPQTGAIPQVVVDWLAENLPDSGTSGPGGTTDHAALTNRSAADQHPIGAITGLQTALDGKAGATHGHTIGDVQYLQIALDNKAEAGHTHTAAQISDATTTGRAVMQASSATAARTAIGAGTSNLALGTGPTTAAAGDHGHDLNAVTDTASRVAMTPAERTKLSGVASGATANATDAQLRDRATHTGAQAISTVTGLQTALDGKAETGHLHDARYVRTVNGTGPDGAGNVAVAGGSTTQAINAQTGTAYTLAAADAGKVVTSTNAAAQTITVPANVFTAGQRVDVLRAGAGSLTLAAGSGMTLNGTPSLVTRAQWSAVSVLFLSATSAVVIGDLASA